VPNLVCNLVSVRQFMCYNTYSLEFDAFDFSSKDLQTGRVILHCNSDGDLYTFLPAASFSLWHHQLSHPDPIALASLRDTLVISCNKTTRTLCHACLLGKHTCPHFRFIVKKFAVL
jgi:hypothetical protein